MRRRLLSLIHWLFDTHPYRMPIDNCPCLDKDGYFIGWFSRSIAAASFIYAKIDSKWCVLAAERGEEAADFNGLWNCSCGYLNFNETVVECAARELKEEIGISLDTSEFVLVGINDSPSANRQNVTFHYGALIQEDRAKCFKFSHELNEGMEVGKIEWVPLEEVPNRKWAFGHDKYIQKYFEALVE